ncbi:hypothetical protein ACF061_21455 [Streptomyces sp. NPDC015220]
MIVTAPAESLEGSGDGLDDHTALFALGAPAADPADPDAATGPAGP